MRGHGTVRRSTWLNVFLSSFLFGLIISRRIPLGNFWIVVLACSLIPPLAYFHHKLSLLSIIILGLVLGNYRGSVFSQSLLPYRTFAGRLVSVRAVALDDAVYGRQSQITFDAGRISLLSPERISLPGSIKIGGYGEPMIYRGDTVVIIGKLFPTRGSRQASMGYAQIQRVAVGSSRVDAIRSRFVASIQSILPAPLGSFGLGLLVGQRSTLPVSLNDQLSAVGLTHIVAVSGYNLTILIQFVRRLMQKRSKYQATVITFGIIGLFMLVTGSSASIVRAAMVSGLSLWAWYYGRALRPSVLILLVAALSAGWFPVYLWSDIGWYLSFLAFSGILIVAPQITRRIFGSKKPHAIAQLCIETFSAQLMTVPIIMFILGRVSTISFVSNIIIVPLVPLAMGLSFVAGLAGMLVPSFAGWFAFPARILLTYMIDSVRYFAKIPASSLSISLTTTQVIVSYCLIVGILLLWWRKTPTNDNITE